MWYGALIVALCLVPVFFISNAFAESSETEMLRSKVDKMEKELSEVKDLLKQQLERDMKKGQEIAELREKDAKKDKEIASLKEVDAQKEKEIASLKKEVAETQVVPSEEGSIGGEAYFAKKYDDVEKKHLGPAFRDPYTKPFLRRFGRNTYVGGYMDFEYWASESDSGNHGFDQHRFIPFIYSDISDRVKLAAEIEFEHGGVEGGRDGEVILEFATMDFLITDWINYRAGFILTPLGKFNLVHDSPLQDLTDRPLISQYIIPTTLTDAGMGFFGSLYPTELGKLDYEVYVTNGVFHGLDDAGDSDFTANRGLRASRGGFEFDNENQSPGVVGRIAYSPFIGLEFGGSTYTQRYDDKNENQITIPALDFAYQKGPFELVGEGAYAFIETNDFAEDAGIADSMWGYYLEGRYHFMPSCLRSWAPKIFTENSTFTGVLRWDQVKTSELDATDGRIDYLRNRVTPGINYRYTEDTVFKFDYQINMEEKDLADRGNNAFVFSVATYF
jgi:hypothetical protein